MVLCRAYSPFLAGTIPIEINIESSDLDIICECYDLDPFDELMAQSYKHFLGFRLIKNNDHLSVCQFMCMNFKFEVFAQAKPIQEQNAPVHMLVEYELLKLGGQKSKAGIKSLKKQGLKTEPAFCEYFNFPGDSYNELLKLKGPQGEHLARVIHFNPF